MINRLLQTIGRISTPRNALLLFIVMLPFVFVFFPWRSNRLDAIVGYSMRPFDVRWPYSPQEVYILASDLGEAGRTLYAITEVTLDFAFPIIYATLLSMMLALVWRKTNPEWAWFALLPYLGMLADFAENICIGVMMMMFPNDAAWLAWLSNGFSLIKWIIGLTSFGAFLLGLGVIVYNRLKEFLL